MLLHSWDLFYERDASLIPTCFVAKGSTIFWRARLYFGRPRRRCIELVKQSIERGRQVCISSTCSEWHGKILSCCCNAAPKQHPWNITWESWSMRRRSFKPICKLYFFSFHHSAPLLQIKIFEIVLRINLEVLRFFLEGCWGWFSSVSNGGPIPTRWTNTLPLKTSCPLSRREFVRAVNTAIVLQIQTNNVKALV